LGSGERSAIAIALEHPGAWLLVDELRARKIAGRLGLDVRGTLAVLVEAKRRGLVPAIGPLIERLSANGMWLGPALIAAALRTAGELPR
jgi:predicted nucleic acid-binding protein